MLWSHSDEEATERVWQRHFAALLKYGEQHGTCNILCNIIYECDLPGMGLNGGIYKYKAKLGEWLHSQRQFKNGKRKSKLAPSRNDRLQKLVDEGRLFLIL